MNEDGKIQREKILTEVLIIKNSVKSISTGERLTVNSPVKIDSGRTSLLKKDVEGDSEQAGTAQEYNVQQMLSGIKEQIHALEQSNHKQTLPTTQGSESAEYQANLKKDLRKEYPSPKDWPTFDGTGEYNHQEFIDW